MEGQLGNGIGRIPWWDDWSIERWHHDPAIMDGGLQADQWHTGCPESAAAHGGITTASATSDSAPSAPLPQHSRGRTVQNRTGGAARYIVLDTGEVVEIRMREGAWPEGQLRSSEHYRPNSLRFGNRGGRLRNFHTIMQSLALQSEEAARRFAADFCGRERDLARDQIGTTIAHYLGRGSRRRSRSREQSSR